MKAFKLAFLSLTIFAFDFGCLGGKDREPVKVEVAQDQKKKIPLWKRPLFWVVSGVATVVGVTSIYRLRKNDWKLDRGLFGLESDRREVRIDSSAEKFGVQISNQEFREMVKGLLPHPYRYYESAILSSKDCPGSIFMSKALGGDGSFKHRSTGVSDFKRKTLPEEVTVGGATLKNVGVLPGSAKFYYDGETLSEDAARKLFGKDWLTKKLVKDDYFKPVGKVFPTEFGNDKELKKLPMSWAACSGCHVQRAFNFFENESGRKYVRKEGVFDMADDKNCVFIISASGINLAGADKKPAVKEALDEIYDATYRLSSLEMVSETVVGRLADSMWRTTLSAAKKEGITEVYTPPLGLSEFLKGLSGPQQFCVKKVVLQRLMAQLERPEFKDLKVSMGSYKYNGEFVEISNILKSLNKLPDNFEHGAFCPLSSADKRCSKGVKAAAVNASDPMVMFRQTDVGMFYLGEQVGGSQEEAIGQGTTAALCSANELCAKAWENPIKV